MSRFTLSVFLTSIASARRATCKLAPIVVLPFDDDEKMRCDSVRQQARLRRAVTLEQRKAGRH